jgi:hypothetical protein
MSVFVRVRAVRLILAAGAGAEALAWGAVTALSLLIGAAAVDELSPLALSTRSILLGVAIFAALAVIASLAWRDRHVASLRRVALWIEEHEPGLEYRLVTSVETGDERFVTRDSVGRWTGTASRRAVRVVLTPMIVLIAAAIVMVLLPRGAVARVSTPHAGDALDRTGRRAPGASRLSPLVARVAAPSYTGEALVTMDEPTDVHALIGSVVTLTGRGVPDGIIGVVGTDTITAAADGDRWRMTVPVTARAAAVTIVDRGFTRIVAIEPVVDAPPTVTLDSPAHDSVLHAPRGRIALAANVSDDFGIASAAFELIVSSGDGENFTFRSTTVGAVHPSARQTTIRATLSLDSLELKPGDIVHVRAVARDGNTVSGPGIGTSETRAIRIARADEYDSVSVDAAPPGDAEKSAISERMLIVLAEALERNRPKLAHDSVVNESRSIGADQKKLRRAVGEIVFTRLGGDPSGEEHGGDESPARAATLAEMLARADSATNASIDPTDFGGGESPVIAVNKPLLEAYNAMWDASNALEIGDPSRALPHMRAALAAMERARQADRLYLRGRPPQVVIDLARVRLTGKDKGAPSVRTPLAPIDSARQAVAVRLLRIVDLSAGRPAAAADSLLVLRIDVVGDQPRLASILAAAADAIRRGRSAAANDALVRARRALAGTPVAVDSLGKWGSTVP